MSARKAKASHRGRRIFLLSVMMVAVGLLVWRAVDLQLLQNTFLLEQGDARSLRVVSIPAHRGMITDRNGEPLAISTPVDSIWADPQTLLGAATHLPKLAALLDLKVSWIKDRLRDNADREFVYLKRAVPPALADRVMALNIAGVAKQREYRRYYPAGEVAGHVLGFTNVDDVGQEGIELEYEKSLRGTPGSMRVIKDRLGRIVETVERINEPVPGHNLKISLDRRIQYLAYRELKATVQESHAASGSAVILDVNSGEVLAMVNQPTYNPNNRDSLRSSHYRNRAVTDVFEPGSTVKPFTIAMALESGKYRPDTLINTAPGTLRLGPNTIHDTHDYGLINVSTVIAKSSNVGASKIALSLPADHLWNMFHKVGFGSVSGGDFPGETAGTLPDYHRWYPIDHATFSFGYGLSVSTLQLARAYMVLADGGVLKPVSFVPVDQPPEGERVMSAKTARQVITMMDGVVSDEGTGERARVPGYHVAGKTGTVRKSIPGGYAEDKYVALFAGMIPATRPRLVMVVMINDPRSQQFYGGSVAAPVFSRVMSEAMRLLDIAPDDLPSLNGAKVARADVS